MKNKIKITDIQKERVFQVPEGYFQRLPVLIQKKIQEISTLEGKLMPRDNIFLIPESYFEQLPQDIQAKISNLSPNALPQSSSGEIFKTPENYFDELSQKIQAKVAHESTSTQIFSLKSLRPVYSLAGVLILCLLIYGGLRLLYQAQDLENQIVQQENKNQDLPKNQGNSPNPDQITQDQLQKDEVDDQVKQTNQESLEPKTKIEHLTSNKSNQIAYLALKEVPKEEIDAYLKDSHHSQEEIVETILSSEQAAASDILADLLLDSEDEEIYQEITDQDLEELDQIFDTKNNKKSE